MCNAVVINGVLNSAVFDAILVNWMLRRIVRPYINHSTKLYVRKDSFQINVLFLRS